MNSGFDARIQRSWEIVNIPVFLLAIGVWVFTLLLLASATILTSHCRLSQELGILSEYCASNIFLVICTWETDAFKISALTSISLHSIFKLASICPRSIVA